MIGYSEAQDRFKAEHAEPERFATADPRVGGDFVFLRQLSDVGCFNPRPRVGGDQVFPCPSDLFPVSIRAPAWGAMLLAHAQSSFGAFQSAPPRGGDSVYFSNRLVAGCEGKIREPRYSLS